MRSIILTLLFICLAEAIHAQPAMLYKDIPDYINNKYIVEDMRIEQRKQSDVKLLGGADYMIYSKADSIVSDDVEEYYPFVDANGILYVNCSFIKEEGFGTAFYLSEDYLFFRGPESKLSRSEDFGYAAAGITGAAAGGIVGAAVVGGIAGAANAGNKFNYAIDLKTGTTHYAGRKFMKELLGKKSELFKDFRKEAYLEEAVLLKYLKAYYE